jgi:hypothetical protein
MSAMTLYLFGGLAAALRALVAPKPKRPAGWPMPVEYLVAPDGDAALGVHCGSPRHRRRVWFHLNRRVPGRHWRGDN